MNKGRIAQEGTPVDLYERPADSFVADFIGGANLIPCEILRREDEAALVRFGDTELWKLFLFRKGKGRYEKRLERQDASMSDIEVHEHVVVDGSTGRLKNPVRHENWNSLDRYISKHN